MSKTRMRVRCGMHRMQRSPGWAFFGNRNSSCIAGQTKGLG
jgi:hypothetical protein